MRFTKIREVKSPERGTELSAGIDFFLPTLNDSLIKDITGYDFTFYDNHIVIHPQGRILIPFGIKVALPSNTMLTAFNKSGIATRLGLIMGACVVDEDYQGELYVSLINTSNKTISIADGQKLAQFILVPILYNKPEEISEEDFVKAHQEGEKQNSTRGAKGFGSTGDK